MKPGDGMKKTQHKRTRGRTVAAPKFARPLLGAEKVGTKVVVRREVLSVEDNVPTARLVTHSLPMRSGRVGGAGNWMDHPEVPRQLLGAFARAVSDAKRASQAAK